MIRRAREDRNGVEVRRPFEHLLERIKKRIAAVGVAKALAAVRAQVGDRGDLAVRMQVPLKRSSKPASHNPRYGSFSTKPPEPPPPEASPPPLPAPPTQGLSLP